MSPGSPREPTRSPGGLLPTSRVAPSLALGLAFVLTACDPGAKAARDLDAACAEGDAAACNDLGYRMAWGQDVLRDWRRAAELYGDACAGGEGQGCLRLGRLHIDGDAEERGVPFDSAAAAGWLLRGCDHGAMEGCVELAAMYLEEDSVIPDVTPTGPRHDPQRAATLLNRACEGGNAGGCTNLGALYRDGTGVTADTLRAVSLFQGACDDGDMLGCAYLGEAYAAGSGVPMDPARAATLYEEACEGSMVGCFNLAGLLLDPAHGEPDPDRAVELYQKACDGTRELDEGAPPLGLACYRLGDVLATGNGVERDVFRASRLFRRACRLGVREACGR